VVEGDSNFHFPNQPMMLLPVFTDHEINDTLRDARVPVMMVQSRGVDVLENVRSTLNIQPVLSTTMSAYGKNDPDSQTINREPGDIDGPFNLAVAVTENLFVGDATINTKIVAMGTSFLFSEQINQMVGGSNTVFFLHVLNWLADKTEADTVFVAPTMLQGPERLVLTQGQANIIRINVIFILPIVIFLIGIVIWLKRRHK
jgi:ABC-type uncharacterized transport system involved in gliding motility auxiliary subunit